MDLLSLLLSLFLRACYQLNLNMNALVSGGFELEKTFLSINTSQSDSPFHNKKIVFTGSMKRPRTELEKQAKALGIVVSKSVSSKTDFLITGENVGQSKLKSANTNDVSILTEEQYLKILNTK